MAVALTSTRAFWETVSERDIQSGRLMSLYRQQGPMSDRKASYILGWERAAVSARRNDLMRARRVAALGEIRDPDTGKRVNVYGEVRETLF